MLKSYMDLYRGTGWVFKRDREPIQPTNFTLIDKSLNFQFKTNIFLFIFYCRTIFTIEHPTISQFICEYTSNYHPQEYWTSTDLVRL